MKKLILTLCLAGAMYTTSAQEKFVEKYTTYSKSTDSKNELHPTNITIVFNEEGTTDIVVYGLEKAKKFYKVGAIEKGKTKSGYEYQFVPYVDAEDGTKVFFQVFDTACRIFVGSEYVEYQK